MAASEDAWEDVGRLAASHAKVKDVLSRVVLYHQHVWRAPRAAGLLYPANDDLVERRDNQFATA